MKPSPAVVQLKVGEIQAPIEYRNSSCGSTCLLADPSNFTCALPEGLGKSGQTAYEQHFIFLTTDHTIIKRRKYYANEQTAGFGLSYQFSRDKQLQAFETLREKKPAGICIPLRECECSYEMQYISGKLVSLHSSLYAPSLEQKYQVEYLSNRSEAILFLKKAWATLVYLHQLGIQHGDPTHYNFITNEGRITLIDLDETIAIEGNFSSWDFGIFLLYSFLPVVNEFFPTDSLADIFIQVFGEEFSLSHNALTEFIALTKLPVSQFHELSRYRAQTETNKQARIVAGEELDVKALDIADEERLTVLKLQAETIATLRQQINILQGQLAELNILRNQSLQLETFKVAAEERLAVIHSQIDAISALRANNLELESYRTAALELENSLAQKTQLESEQNATIIKLEKELATLKVELQLMHSLCDAQSRTIEEQTRLYQSQERAHSAAYENASLMAEARLKVIDEQQKTIESFQRWKIKERLKIFIRPQLGVLYQYPPQPVTLPARYQKNRPPKQAQTISIVTPSYNQGGFIERTIQSVLSQNYPNLEYILQDGDSKDQTMEVVKKYAHKMKHYESVKDNGQTHALNLGFRHATGEIMAYLNSDDLLLPGSLNYIANYFFRHPEVDVVYGHRVIIDEYDQEVGRWIMPPHDDEVLSWADYIPQETLFWRRAAWEKAGGSMDESFRFAMDWDLILRLRDSGARMRRLPRFLGAFRVHPHQKTSAQITEIGNQEMARLRERCAGRPVPESEAWYNVRPYLKRHVAYRMLQKFLPVHKKMKIN